MGRWHPHDRWSPCLSHIRPRPILTDDPEPRTMPRPCTVNASEQQRRGLPIGSSSSRDPALRPQPSPSWHREGLRAADVQAADVFGQDCSNLVSLAKGLRQ
jgi:hypothetical protein